MPVSIYIYTVIRPLLPRLNAHEFKYKQAQKASRFQRLQKHYKQQEQQTPHTLWHK